MSRLLVTAALSLAVAGPVVAQDHHAPYAGLEQRSIKALSEEQVESYLTGSGMGFALAAELNHYPGPRHVLELADSLMLSADQASTARRVFDAMRAEAVALGTMIVAKERALDTLFATGEVSDQMLDSAVMEIASLSGKLRYTHLRAHLAMKDLLSERQIMLYDRLRGYGGGHDARQHHAHE